MLRGRFRVGADAAGASLGVVHSRGQQVETPEPTVWTCERQAGEDQAAREGLRLLRAVCRRLSRRVSCLRGWSHGRPHGRVDSASGEHTETAAERPCAPMRAKGSAAAGYDLQRLLDSHAVRVPVARGAPGLAPAKQKSTESISCSTQRLLRPPRCRPPAVADGKPGHRARSARSWELSRPTLSPRCSRIT
jgi:hypothetical protein